jgi:membrane-bound lytic murein transglycosylase D
MSCFNKSEIALIILLLCLVPGAAFSDTALSRARATASEILPVIEAPKSPTADQILSKTPSQSELDADGPQDAWDEIKSGPRMITVSPGDKKAQLAVRESLRMFTKSIRQRFSMWLERSGRYIEIMHEVLKERNMPTELVFLPIVESGFNPLAYSKARAVGPWQFIAETGKRYGLAIDWWRDERKDPVKSTIAASKYLRDLYNMFGSWSLALAAYNAGEGRISKAVKRSNSGDFWKLSSAGQIAQETRSYVPHFIAAAMIAREPEKYGFDNLDYHEPFEYDEVIVYQPVDLDVAAKCADTTVDNIKSLNPELRRWSTPPHLKKYTLRIPSGKADSFINKLSKMPDSKIFSYDRHTVKRGENIRSVAARAKVPVRVILDLNSLAGIERLRPGTALKLPPRGKYFADIDDRMTAIQAAKEKLIDSNFVIMGSVIQIKAPDDNSKKAGKKGSGDRGGRKTGKSAKAKVKTGKSDK